MRIEPRCARRRDRARGLCIAAAAFLAGCASLSGGSTGVVDGKLQPCPSAPHCVGSDDPQPAHRIAPLRIRGDAEAAWRSLKAYLAAFPRTRFVEQRADYCHVTATSRWLRFTDDVEFLLRSDRGEIAMRSSSRLGYYDFGVNRNRLEAIRAALRARKFVE